MAGVQLLVLWCACASPAGQGQVIMFVMIAILLTVCTFPCWEDCCRVEAAWRGSASGEVGRLEEEDSSRSDGWDGGGCQRSFPDFLTQYVGIFSGLLLVPPTTVLLESFGGHEGSPFLSPSLRMDIVVEASSSVQTRDSCFLAPLATAVF